MPGRLAKLPGANIALGSKADAQLLATRRAAGGLGSHRQRRKVSTTELKRPRAGAAVKREPPRASPSNSLRQARAETERGAGRTVPQAFRSRVLSLGAAGKVTHTWLAKGGGAGGARLARRRGMLLRRLTARMAVIRLAPPGLSERQEQQQSRPAAWSCAPGLRVAARGLANRRQDVPKADGTAAEGMAKEARLPTRRFITCPKLARTLVSRLEAQPGTELQKALVVECEPGPGILTRMLLSAGAQVIALESNKSYFCDLEILKEKLGGQLEVVHCDFFKLDPIGLGLMKPPVMYSENLFDKLGILPVAWTADVPVKVVGIVPQKRERNLLWKLLYALYQRSSVYKYGRIELNLLISEKEYKTLVAKPSEGRIYQALSILWQTACDIQLMHMEPWSSFLTNSKNANLSIPKSVLLLNDHLCLVRLTPRKDLFTDNLTTANSRLFVFLVKQCLTKSKTKLIDRLNLWTCENGKHLLGQLKIPENSTTGSLYPEQYKSLFLLLQQCNKFDESWVYDDDLMEDYGSMHF